MTKRTEEKKNFENLNEVETPFVFRAKKRAMKCKKILVEELENPMGIINAVVTDIEFYTLVDDTTNADNGLESTKIREYQIRKQVTGICAGGSNPIKRELHDDTPSGTFIPYGILNNCYTRPSKGRNYKHAETLIPKTRTELEEWIDENEFLEETPDEADNLK